MSGQASGPAPDWTPRDIDNTTPSTARIYDYLLGGGDNYEADRTAAQRVLEALPDIRKAVRANRGFLVEAVRRASAEDIDQFIDLGTGIPTSPNVHQVAREAHPAARVIYVDNDPIVTAHNRALREVDANVGVVEADIRDPASVLTHPETTRLIDFTAPVAVLAVAVLHFVTDDEDPAGTIAAFRESMVSGSHLVLSVASTDGLPPEAVAEARQTWANATSPLTPRSREEIQAWMTGFDLTSELASTADWCADDSLQTQAKFLAGIARKADPVR